jgi:hypothetical protein
VADHLVSLIVDSWRAVDVPAEDDMAAYFTADGVFDLGGAARFAGRAAIQASLRQRTARGPRTSRHVTSNYRCTLDGDDRAAVEYLICTYGADGEPVVPLEGPTAVGDMRDDFVCDADGRWWIASRVFTPVFVDEERFAPSVRGDRAAPR